MSLPFVSVLIDTYNYGHFIEQAIDSVLSQDFPSDRMELLVIDDGSTDDTVERVTKYGSKIQYLRKENGGQASAFNFGFLRSRGDIVCFLDADDYWFPGKLRKVVDEFQKEPAAMVSNDYELSDPDSRGSVACNLDLVSGQVPADLESLLRYRAFPTSCLAFRREPLGRLLPMPETIKLQADSYVALLIIFVGPVRALPDKLSMYRIHGENLYSALGTRNTPESQRRRFQTMKTILEEMRRWLTQNGFDTRERTIRAFLDQWTIFHQAAEYAIDPPTRWQLCSHLLRYNRTYKRRQNWKLTILNYFAAMAALVRADKRSLSVGLFKWKAVADCKQQDAGNVSMRIVHVSTHDVWGGAALAAHRLHLGLRAIGQDSMMFVAHRAGEGSGVLRFVPPRDIRSRLVRSWRRKSLARELDCYARSRPADAELFSDDRTQYLQAPLLQMPPCDVLHLHWFSEFLDCQSLFNWIPRGMPVFWTLHDMNAFTGGCHFDSDCRKHRSNCGACPKLGSTEEDDLSRQVWKRRQQAYSRMALTKLHLVAPSRWMAAEVGQSALLGRFPVTVIPHGLDLDAFAPRNRTFAREVLGVPQNANVLLFAAHTVSERRKGLHFLAEALAGLREDPNLFLLVAGRYSAVEQIGIPYRSLGFISNERLLSIAYSAADICVVPTLQDAMPMTVIESLACGTPVIGFPVGCLPDIVRDGVTGQLVPLGDSRALREGIRVMLACPEGLTEMRVTCRRIAMEQYSTFRLARDHVRLYESCGAQP